MSFLERVDVLILTLNEATNIGRTLMPLREFRKVVVLDSGSTDETRQIARAFSNVEVHQRAFDTHASQWSYGLEECGLGAEWVLALDADYVLTPALLDELRSLEPAPGTAGYWASFRYCIEGRPLAGSLYPPVMILYRREVATYRQDGHAQRVVVSGPAMWLRGLVLHDDRKSFSTWLAAQDRYARLECEHLLSTPLSRLSWRDRLRRMMFVTPWLVPVYCLIVRGGLFDGKPGLAYAVQRGIAESILAVYLLQAHLAGRKPVP